MISRLKGTLVAKGEGNVLIDVGGVGFEVHVPEGASFFAEEEGAELTVHTYLVVREDELSLYGFEERRALSLFQKLISVSGVGPKAALAILSLGSADGVISAITSADDAYVSQAQGIGKKTADRVILELKDKLENLGAPGAARPSLSGAGSSGAKREAIDALIGLGYKESEATRLVNEAEVGAKEAAAAEDYIRAALKNA
jgi:Holliday junction DNA helicase RuvA